VAIFFNIHGVGLVKWLPALVTQSNDRLAHIRRETGVSRVAFDPPTRERIVSADMEPQRRRIPPKAETRLIQGKRI